MTTDEQYWDKVFDYGIEYENTYKRQAIMARVMKTGLIGNSVLEIGSGLAVCAAAVNIALVGRWKYLGIELSGKTAQWARENTKLDVVQGEITAIPTKGKFDMVWAFDVLEHVRPQDRVKGYKEIARVLSDTGKIILHQTKGKSGHKPEHDYGFRSGDLEELMNFTGTQIESFENYFMYVPGRNLVNYQWIVLQR